MLSPAALSILMSTFREGHPRAHALAAWGAVGGAGAAVGVLFGGALTELVGWQAIFLINVPVGARPRACRPQDHRSATPPRRAGADSTSAAPLLATTGLGGDRVRALAGRRRRLDAPPTSLGPGAAGVAGLVAFVHRRAPDRLTRCCASTASPTAASAAGSR